MKEEYGKYYHLIIIDKSDTIIMEREADLEDFSVLLDDAGVLDAKNDAELEFYLINHPELRIVECGKKYYHQQYLAGKGMTTKFVFFEE